MNSSGLSTPPATPNTTPKSIALYDVTIQQPEAGNASLIRMDSDVYNPGEVIDFSLVRGNQPVVQGCDILSFRIFLKDTHGSWKELPGPFRAYVHPGAPQPAATNFPVPSGGSTEYRFVTTGWEPGYYEIRSDCLNATHEFILRNITLTTSVIRN